MAYWGNRLNLIDLWKARDDGNLTISELARRVADRIRAMGCYEKYGEILGEIADQFEYCSDDVEEFDGILNDLYDWGDTVYGPNPFKKMCWIATRF